MDVYGRTKDRYGTDGTIDCDRASGNDPAWDWVRGRRASPPVDGCLSDVTNEEADDSGMELRIDGSCTRDTRLGRHPGKAWDEADDC